jgi:hypothetical protein
MATFFEDLHGLFRLRCCIEGRAFYIVGEICRLEFCSIPCPLCEAPVQFDREGGRRTDEKLTASWRLDLLKIGADTCGVKSLALAAWCILTAVLGGGLPAPPYQSAAPPELSTASIQLSPAEIQLYNHASTLINWSPREIRQCPYLNKLRPAANQAQLARILEGAGRSGDLLLTDFPQISCVEEVRTETELPHGSCDEDILSSPFARSPCGTTAAGADLTLREFPPQDRKFRYIVIPRTKGGLPGFEEYRTDLSGSPLGIASLTRVYMITSNFVSIGLYLTAPHQPESTFRYFGTQTLRKQECYVVGFAQSPLSVRAVGLITVHGKSAALLVQGLAWVDSETFQTLRVTIWLLAPRNDVGLRSSLSTVDFFPIQPSGSRQILWLPRDVTVRGLYHGVVFNNTHHYSDFKLFRVESTIKPGE